jgi:hypothetical protein
LKNLGNQKHWQCFWAKSIGFYKKHSNPDCFLVGGHLDFGKKGCDTGRLNVKKLTWFAGNFD